MKYILRKPDNLEGDTVVLKLGCDDETLSFQEKTFPEEDFRYLVASSLRNNRDLSLSSSQASCCMLIMSLNGSSRAAVSSDQFLSL